MSKSLQFIVIMGIVSLFADITYEGSRSFIGPFLSVLGASGAVVGVVSGLGELIGYSIRLLSGYAVDKTKRYWLITIIGYIITLLSVPMLAFTNTWQTASIFIISERLGKAIRKPARDAMLSFASQKTGRGWGFGLHEALDQIGAIIGPLLVALLYYGNNSFRASFAILAIPAAIALSLLSRARMLFPQPHGLEKSQETNVNHSPYAEIVELK